MSEYPAGGAETVGYSTGPVSASVTVKESRLYHYSWHDGCLRESYKTWPRYPNKHEIFNQCCFNVGPASKTVANIETALIECTRELGTWPSGRATGHLASNACVPGSNPADLCGILFLPSQRDQTITLMAASSR